MQVLATILGVIGVLAAWHGALWAWRTYAPRKYPRLADYSGKAPEPICVIRKNRPVWMQPLRAIGQHILCEPVGGTGRSQELVIAMHCTDTAAFWKAWRQCGGSPDVWVDEDGEPYKMETGA